MASEPHVSVGSTAGTGLEQATCSFHSQAVPRTPSCAMRSLCAAWLARAASWPQSGNLVRARVSRHRRSQRIRIHAPRVEMQHGFGRASSAGCSSMLSLVRATPLHAVVHANPRPLQGNPKRTIGAQPQHSVVVSQLPSSSLLCGCRSSCRH